MVDEARAKGLNGIIIYPTVQHTGGVCLAALRPYAVQSVAAGDVYRRSLQISAAFTNGGMHTGFGSILAPRQYVLEFQTSGEI